MYINNILEIAANARITVALAVIYIMLGQELS